MVVPYKPEHLLSMVFQPSQEYLRAYLTPEIAEAVASHEAFSGVAGDRVIGCAGLVKVWEGRALAWAYLSNEASRHMLGITRATRHFLDVFGPRRVEMAVDLEFAEGHRWANMLGFSLEAGRMKSYRPDGGTCSLYARVRA